MYIYPLSSFVPLSLASSCPLALSPSLPLSAFRSLSLSLALSPLLPRTLAPSGSLSFLFTCPSPFRFCSRLLSPSYFSLFCSTCSCCASLRIIQTT